MIIRFYKPYGVLPQFTDAEGRPTLADYIQQPGVYAAGRLDYDSEGLLLLTDDGGLIHRLTDPHYEHPKVYLAQVERIPDDAALQQLRSGVLIQGYKTRPIQAELVPEPQNLPLRTPPVRFRKNVPTTWLRMTLTEGKKRQVRRMTAAVGYPTLRLIRIAIGSLTLDGLNPGDSQILSDAEIRSFLRTLHKSG